VTKPVIGAVRRSVTVATSVSLANTVSVKLNTSLSVRIPSSVSGGAEKNVWVVNDVMVYVLKPYSANLHGNDENWFTYIISGVIVVTKKDEQSLVGCSATAAQSY
jgi:hypothetical protein